MSPTPPFRRSAPTLAVGLCLTLAACATGGTGPSGEDYPDLHLRYADIVLDAPDAAARLARRIETTAVEHCSRHGARLTPAHRRGQPQFCVDGVRAELVRALPPTLRAIYDEGRRSRSARGAT
jgi:UrcA family protein